jgi:hypothetical protein
MIDDPLSSARGVVAGVAIGAMIWGIIFLAIWAMAN